MAVTDTHRRNLSMECCKMVAALAVVILHVPFPEHFQRYASCLGEFANPIFFAITGYFNYRATSAQLRRRFIHIVKLYLTATLFHLFWSCILIEWNGGSTIAYLRAVIPDPEEIIWWLVYQQGSFLGQLWFLAATGLFYLALWGYTKFTETNVVNYRPLYQMGFVLYTVYFVVSVIMPVTGTEVSFYVYRNGWFLGLPMSILGMFLHEYQERIICCFHLTTAKQLCIIFLSIILNLLQLDSGIPQVTPIANLTLVMGLLLFLADHPNIPGLSQKGQRIVSKFGVFSTGIYLFHITVLLLYGTFLSSFFSRLLGDREVWLRPFLVYVISLLFAIVWERICAGMGKVNFLRLTGRSRG